MSFGITVKFMDDLGLVAREAGSAIMRVYGSDFAVYEKSDASPVTDADREAEEIITFLIRKRLTAKWPIVGEEAAEAGDIPDIAGTPFGWWTPWTAPGSSSRKGRTSPSTSGLSSMDALSPAWSSPRPPKPCIGAFRSAPSNRSARERPSPFGAVPRRPRA